MERSPDSHYTRAAAVVADCPTVDEHTAVEEGVPPELLRAEHQSALFLALESMPAASQDYLATLSPAHVGELAAEFFRKRTSEGKRTAQCHVWSAGGGAAAQGASHGAVAEPEAEAASATRIQRAYRGHRDRRAFFKLVAQLSAGTGDGRNSVYAQIANRSARKFWTAHFGDRQPSHSEVLEAFDMWLRAGGVDGAI